MPLASTTFLRNGSEPLGSGHLCLEGEQTSRGGEGEIKKKYIYIFECLKVRPQRFPLVNILKLPVLFNLLTSILESTVAE